MKHSAKLFLLSFLALSFSVSNRCLSQVYLDSTASVDDRVADLVGRMTLDEKLGQMVQTERNLAAAGGILACAKHYIGDGGTKNGTDRGNTIIDEAGLRQIHLPGYATAIGAGVGSVMVSYSSWNGTACSINKYLITNVLREELGYEGFVVSDWDALRTGTWHGRQSGSRWCC